MESVSPINSSPSRSIHVGVCIFDVHSWSEARAYAYCSWELLFAFRVCRSPTLLPTFLPTFPPTFLPTFPLTYLLHLFHLIDLLHLFDVFHHCDSNPLAIWRNRRWIDFDRVNRRWKVYSKTTDKSTSDRSTLSLESQWWINRSDQLINWSITGIQTDITMEFIFLETYKTRPAWSAIGSTMPFCCWLDWLGQNLNYNSINIFHSCLGLFHEF